MSVHIQRDGMMFHVDPDKVKWTATVAVSTGTDPSPHLQSATPADNYDSVSFRHTTGAITSGEHVSVATHMNGLEKEEHPLLFSFGASVSVKSSSNTLIRPFFGRLNAAGTEALTANPNNLSSIYWLPGDSYLDPGGERVLGAEAVIRIGNILQQTQKTTGLVFGVMAKLTAGSLGAITIEGSLYTRRDEVLAKTWKTAGAI